MKRELAPWLLALAAVILAVCVFFDTRRREPDEAPEEYTRRLVAMDTVMSFTAYGPNASEALDAVLAEIQRLDALLSTGAPQSEVSRLNASGSLTVSEDTAALFRAAGAVYEATGGLFDCTVYPLMELWGFPTKAYRVPTAEELSAALALVDFGAAGIDGARVTLGEGQKVDFGGIAKGYAASRAMELFREYGVKSAMVNLGGNIQTLGTKPDGSPWRIGVQDPESSRGAILAALPVSDRAVVTSGGYERYFEAEGRRYVHILDPRTGLPASSDIVSATVIAADGTKADALSTALFLMGTQAAADFWRARSGEFQMVLLDREGRLWATEGAAGELETELEITVIRS